MNFVTRGKLEWGRGDSRGPNASTIRGMLDNPAYMGRAAFGRAHFWCLGPAYDRSGGA